MMMMMMMMRVEVVDVEEDKGYALTPQADIAVTIPNIRERTNKVFRHPKAEMTTSIVGTSTRLELPAPAKANPEAIPA